MGENSNEGLFGGDGCWEVDGLRFTVGLGSPALNLMVRSDVSISSIIRIHSSSHKSLDGIVHDRGVLVKRKVLELGTDLRLQEASPSQVLAEVIRLKGTCAVAIERGGEVLSGGAGVAEYAVDEGAVCEEQGGGDGLHAEDLVH